MLVRSAAQDRAVNAAVTQTQAVAPAIVAADRQSLADVVNQANADGGYQLTVFLPDGTTLGVPAARSPAVAQAGTGSSLTVDADGGREVLVAVAGRSEGTVVIRTFVSDADLGRGVERAWLVLGLLGLALAGQAYHSLEHVVKIVQFLETGRNGTPGVLGQWIPVVWLHFAFNTLIYAPLLAAFFLGGFPRAIGRDLAGLLPKSTARRWPAVAFNLMKLLG
jgi:hypothetical protein